MRVRTADREWCLRPALRGCVCGALLVSMWLSPSRTSAQDAAADATPETSEAASRDEDARTIFELGRAAYQEGRYEAALEHFERAYELSARPALLFNIGSAADRLRRDESAVRAYRRYLAEVEDAPNRALVERRIALIGERAGGAGADATGAWALVGVGAALAVGGGVCLGVGLADLAAVESGAGMSWDSLRDQYERSPILQGVGIAGAAVGLAMVGVGLAWALSTGGGDGETEVAIGPGHVTIRRAF